MQDTPEHIKEIHLKLWLSKPPGERLLQALKNNKAMYIFSQKGREAMARLHEQQNTLVQTSANDPSPKTFC